MIEVFRLKKLTPNTEKPISYGLHNYKNINNFCYYVYWVYESTRTISITTGEKT